MYEELVKRLRDISNSDSNIKSNYIGLTMLQAADAIEELKHDLDFAVRAEAAAVKAYTPRWIPVTERLPEESEGLNWHEDMMIRFTSVWCYDVNTGCIEVRKRLQRKLIWNDCLDHYTKDTDWHWSAASWEPTHWMPIVPLPEPPKEET